MPGIELLWPNKKRIPYHVPQRSGETPKPIYYGDPGTPTWPDHRPLQRISTHGDPTPDPNRLIQGDNLLALQSLLDEGMERRFKRICIDPPYNTGSAFAHYDDGYENTIWLGMMRDRVKMLYKLLSDDGSLWIFIDDNQAHYLKVACDEIFGRGNFVASIIWQKNFSPNSTAGHISLAHDHILVYAKDIGLWTRNLLPRAERQDKAYKNLDGDARGIWASSDLSARNFYSQGSYPITTSSGRVISGPAKGRYRSVSQENFTRLRAENRIWFGVNGKNMPRLKRFLSEVMDGIVPQSIWFQGEVGNTQEAKKEVMAAAAEDAEVFQTPKPERVIKRVIQLSTNPGDWVPDSFAGSGTTAAVAYQMDRRWITIEQGDHAQTHCLPRLEKVRLGAAPYKFAAGGGFVFEKVGPPLVIRDDALGRDTLNPAYVNGEYQRAVCLRTGFKHQPDDPLLHGRAGAESRRYCHVAARGLLVTEEYLEPIGQALSALTAANGQDFASCIVYATKTATVGGEEVEVVRIPAGFTSKRKKG